MKHTKCLFGVAGFSLRQLNALWRTLKGAVPHWWILAVAAMIVLAVAGCETGRRVETVDKNIGVQSCKADADCTGDKLCFDGICKTDAASGGECDYSSDCPGDELCKDGACVGLEEWKDEDEDESDGEDGEGDVDWTNTISPSIEIKTESLSEAVCYEKYKQNISVKTNWSGGFNATVTGLPKGFKPEVKGSGMSLSSDGQAGDCNTESLYNISIQVCLKAKPDTCTDGTYTLKIQKLEPLKIEGAEGCIFTANTTGNCTLTAVGGSGEYEWVVKEDTTNSLEQFEAECSGASCEISGDSTKKAWEKEIINVTLTDKKSGLTLTESVEIGVQETFGILVSGKEVKDNKKSVWSEKKKLGQDETSIAVDVNDKTAQGEVKLYIIGGFGDGNYAWTVTGEGSGSVALYQYGYKNEAGSKVYSKYPVNDTEVTFNNKSDAFLMPADSYKGEELNLIVVVSEKGAQGRSATVNFTNLKFEKYVCATEPKLTVNGVTADDSNVIALSKVYKPGQQIKLGSDDLFEITSDASNTIIAPYLGQDDEASFNITAQPTDNACKFQAKEYTIKYNVEYPSYEKDTLQHFIIDLGEIIDTGKNSYFKMIIYDKNGSELAYSKNIYLKGAELDNRRVEVTKWQEKSDDKWQELEKLNIDLNDITKIKFSLHDECEYFCTTDMDITIKEVLLLGKYHFAFLAPNHHKEVDGENANYFACFENTDEKDCNNKYVPKNKITYEGETSSSSESDFWFKRKAADDCPEYFWNGGCYKPAKTTDGGEENTFELGAIGGACATGATVGGVYSSPGGPAISAGGATIGCAVGGAIEFFKELF